MNRIEDPKSFPSIILGKIGNPSTFFLGFVFLFLMGCEDTGYRSPYTYKVTEMGNTAVITTDASKRSILVHLNGQKFCAEPVPDATGTLATQLATQLSGGIQIPGSKKPAVQGKFGINDSGNAGLSKLFQRSQGVQVLRDGMYRLCEAHLNGAIDQDTYADQLIGLITTLDYVVPMELCSKILNEERKNGENGQPNMVTRKEVPEQLLKDCINASYNFAKAVNEQSLGIRLAKYRRQNTEVELEILKERNKLAKKTEDSNLSNNDDSEKSVSKPESEN